MGADRYEVLIAHAKTGRQTKREWSASELMAAVQWLKRLNASGGDILVRPLGGPELRLIGTLDANGVDKLRSRGLAPAATVETRPGRFEAWLKLSDQSLPPSLRDALLARVTHRFGEAGLYGRLAGFTNQQADSDTAGRHPFALLHNATGQVAPVAVQQLAEFNRNTFDARPKQLRPLDAATARAGARGRSR
jgi:hypothetical protein